MKGGRCYVLPAAILGLFLGGCSGRERTGEELIVKTYDVEKFLDRYMDHPAPRALLIRQRGIISGVKPRGADGHGEREVVFGVLGLGSIAEARGVLDAQGKAIPASALSGAQEGLRLLLVKADLAGRGR